MTFSVTCAAPKGAFVLSIEDVSQVFEQGLGVNLTGAFTCAREAIKVMRPGSVILNLGACADFLRPASRHTADAYNAAIEMLTRCMAAELGPFGVRTATIVPGHIRTLGVTHWSKFMSRWVARQIPMGRLENRKKWPTLPASWLRLTLPTSPDRSSMWMAG
ncbi:SDR family oxidoreductase [Rhizobium beringeri]